MKSNRNTSAIISDNTVSTEALTFQKRKYKSVYEDGYLVYKYTRTYKLKNGDIKTYETTDKRKRLNRKIKPEVKIKNKDLPISLKNTLKLYKKFISIMVYF
eukprot:382811_1